MRRRWFLLFAFACLVLGHGSSGRGAEPWRWPLDLEPRAVTGTFMEPRSAHWHAGLDIRTGGRIGAEVRAPAAGWISRLRTSPHGYGKAIYLRTPDGHTLVFAHLSAFAQKLHQPILSAQSRSGRYWQDVAPPTGALRVRRGELIALSGATGTGAPHLHLEVRGPDGRPRDPQHWLPAADDQAPLIRGFRLVPLDAATRLEGRARPCRAAPGDTVHAVGRFAVQVDAVDRTGAAPFTVMPKGFELRLDGERIYRLEQQSYAFSQGREMRLEIAFSPDDDERIRYLRLYARDGNTLAGREGTGHVNIAAGETAEPRNHRLELAVWDIHGHRSTAALTLRADPSAGGDGRPGGRAWTVPAGPDSAAELWASEAVLELGDAGGERVVLELSELGSGAHLVAGPGGGYHELAFLTGGGGIASIGLRGSTVRLTDPDGRGLYRGGVVWLEEARERPTPPAELLPIGSMVRVRSAGAARQDGLDLEVDLPDSVADPDRIFLCQIDARGRWAALDTSWEQRAARRVLLGELEDQGVVTAARDTTPPRLGDFRVQRRRVRDGTVLRESNGKSGPIARPRWPVVAISVDDRGVGLDEDGPIVTLDGRLFPARWDPEDGELLLELFADPGPGPHEFVVVARDRAGNRSSRAIRLALSADR